MEEGREMRQGGVEEEGGEGGKEDEERLKA